jgi:hypothetical protein
MDSNKLFASFIFFGMTKRQQIFTTNDLELNSNRVHFSSDPATFTLNNLRILTTADTALLPNQVTELVGPKTVIIDGAGALTALEVRNIPVIPPTLGISGIVCTKQGRWVTILIPAFDIHYSLTAAGFTLVSVLPVSMRPPFDTQTSAILCRTEFPPLTYPDLPYNVIIQSNGDIRVLVQDFVLTVNRVVPACFGCDLAIQFSV